MQQSFAKMSSVISIEVWALSFRATEKVPSIKWKLDSIH